MDKSKVNLPDDFINIYDMKLLEFKEFIERESDTRTKPLSKEEFLKILRENCKNFSFENDQLWRSFHSSLERGIFIKSKRRATYGDIEDYKQFFLDRTDNSDYPVDRSLSIIGSTKKEFAENLSEGGDEAHLVIPFDNTDIVFFSHIDLLAYKKEFSDDLFILTKYTNDFKIPREELKEIKVGNTMNEYEFFTNGPCLLLSSNEIEWLKSEI